jgi:hypothetical protein
MHADLKLCVEGLNVVDEERRKTEETTKKFE